jgi:hypothetical protein
MLLGDEAEIVGYDERHHPVSPICQLLAAQWRHGNICGIWGEGGLTHVAQF